MQIRRVGTGRFELPTPCSQSRCATRLRHVPRPASVVDSVRAARPGMATDVAGYVCGRGGAAVPCRSEVGWPRGGARSPGDGRPRSARRRRLPPGPARSPRRRTPRPVPPPPPEGNRRGRRHPRPTRPPPAPVPHPPVPPLHAAHGDGARAAVVRAALSQVGWPYVWGGESRTEGGFDCSGLVDHAYARAGYTLPGRPTAAVLWAMSVPLKPAELRPGDLGFLRAPPRP